VHMLVFISLNIKSTISINNDQFLGKIFGFRSVILSALHCKIHCLNYIKVCSLPFVKYLEFYNSILLEVYILVNILKIRDT
jgi:hypothetical protein